MKTLLMICTFFIAQSVFAGPVVPSGTYVGSGTWSQFDASGNPVASGTVSSTWTEQNSNSNYIGTDTTVLFANNGSVFMKNQNQYQFTFKAGDQNAYGVYLGGQGIGTGRTQNNSYIEELNQQGLVIKESGTFRAVTKTLTRNVKGTLPGGAGTITMTLTLIAQ